MSSAPTSPAIWAKVVLQDCSIAWLNGIFAPLAPQLRPSLSISPVWPLVSGSW